MPTRRGIAVLVAGVLFLAAGLLLGYRELAALGLVGVVMFGAALAWAGWPPRLEVVRTVEPDRVVRGDPCRASLKLESTARWRNQILVGEDRVGPMAVPTPMVRLAPDEESQLFYPLPTHRRGVLEVGPLELSRRDPLGLVAASRRYGRTSRLWVHPKTYPLRGVPVGISRSMDGVVDAVQYGSITFHALREYVPGDDLRSVHWRTSAHIGQLMVREHVDTSLPRLVVVLDDRAAAHTPESLEETIEACASVVLAGLRNELHVELHLASGRTIAMQGVHGEARGFLDLLAEVSADSAKSLIPVVRKLRQRHRGDTLVLLTATKDNKDLEPLGILRDVYPTVVLGILGDTPALGGMPGVIVLNAPDAEEFARRWDGVNRW